MTLPSDNALSTVRLMPKPPNPDFRSSGTVTGRGTRLSCSTLVPQAEQAWSSEPNVAPHSAQNMSSSNSAQIPFLTSKTASLYAYLIAGRHGETIAPNGPNRSIDACFGGNGPRGRPPELVGREFRSSLGGRTRFLPPPQAGKPGPPVALANDCVLSGRFVVLLTARRAAVVRTGNRGPKK
jgi:hypothetical protein